MKKLTGILAVLLSTVSFAQTGYEIKVTLKPYKKGYLYLGHYQGKTYPIVDSAKLDANSTAIFKGKKVLPGGIYLIGYPDKKGFFEVLIDKQQRFTVIADTATLNNKISFINSADNTLFNKYQAKMKVFGKDIDKTKRELNDSSSTSGLIHGDSLRKRLETLDQQVKNYREELIKNNPKSMLTALLLAMREPELKGNLAHPTNKEDSLAAYRYFKDHYWDGVNFWDGRLAYTTFFEDKVDKYFKQLVVPDADSTIKEMDWMLAYATPSYEMTKLLLLKFVNRYINQQYMFEDAVFVHLYEKYFANKNYDWLTPEGRKTITDRAFSLMENLVGKPAADIELPDTSGVIKSLYADTSYALTLVCFWDPTCGHCKETLPKMDSLYQAKWKAQNIRIFSVAKETDSKPADWTKFINEHHLQEWTNVYYSKAAEKERISNNIPGYSQLYDVQTFPTLYLLDKQLRIIAKKLEYDVMNDVIDIKLKD